MVPQLQQHFVDLWNTAAARLPLWLTPLGVFLGALVVGYLAKLLLMAILRRWAARTSITADDLFVREVSRPLAFWALLLAVFLASLTAPLTANAEQLVGRTLLILWAASLTLLTSRLAANLVRHFGSQTPGAQPVTSLSQNLARLAVIAVGLMIVLNLFGISITPILTALGVGGLAVALALQDTLSNLFAGFYVSVARQVRLGNYNRLDSGEEGYVSDIGWRSTTVRTLANNLIIIPNNKLAQAIVTNFHLPEKRMSIGVSVGVAYDSDLEQVERLLLEIAQQGVADIPGLVGEPAPSVRLIPGFGDSSLNFTLNCHVGEFVDQFLAQHELRKRIVKRFREAGIEIPFPVRTVRLSGGIGDRVSGIGEDS
jgi:small-conductance mechanosensitive channel